MLDKEHIIKTYSKLDYFELYKEYKQLKIEIQEAKAGKGEVLEVYHSVVEMILLRRSLKIAEKLKELQEVLK